MIKIKIKNKLKRAQKKKPIEGWDHKEKNLNKMTKQTRRLRMKLRKYSSP
jgi:hypothetical protein